MTNIFILKSLTTKFMTSTGALAIAMGLTFTGFSPFSAPSAYADDCLLDTNHDGDADSNIDTNGGAVSGSDLLRLACGSGATAGASGATALGTGANAGGTGSTAIGIFAQAPGDRALAIGADSSDGNLDGAKAAGDFAVAVGVDSVATGNESIVLGYAANAGTEHAIAIGTSAFASGARSIVIGHTAEATDSQSIAIGSDATFPDGEFKGAIASGGNAMAIGFDAEGEFRSIAIGNYAEARTAGSTALGYNADASASYATALGSFARATGFGIAIGAGSIADGGGSTVIGRDASDADFDNALVIGKDAIATENDQVILKSADTFTILGNGDVGIGTAAPIANLDINSGAADTTLLLNNTGAQWEMKSKAANGRLIYKNLTDGGVPFKMGPAAVNGLLSVGTSANDLVQVKGDLDVTGILTTGGPTCSGGCDAVFDLDYNLPSIEEHAAQMYARKHLPQVGPTKPFEPINLTEKVGDMLNELEKAHIYIAQQEVRLARLEKLLEP